MIKLTTNKQGDINPHNNNKNSKTIRMKTGKYKENTKMDTTIYFS